MRPYAIARAALLLTFAAFAGHMAWAVARPMLAGEIAVNDFFAHWSAARYIQAHPAIGLYDAEGLHRFQAALAGHEVKKFPFPYPPVFLFLLAPFGLLPFGWAYLAWMAVSLALYVWASGPTDRAVLLLAPATVLALAYGQTGLLLAAALVGGLRLLPARPALAGVLFGLMLIKPQFAVLLPPALAMARQWRAIGAAAATVAVLAGASLALQGVALWQAWASVLAGHPAYVDQNVSQYVKPTLLGHLLRLGTDAGTAHMAQAALFVAVSAAAIWLFRRPGALPAAALQAGILAGAPYAFLYDLPPATNAALALPRRLPDALVAAASLSMPAVMTLTSRFTWTGVATLLALFAMLALRASTDAAAQPAAPAP